MPGLLGECPVGWEVVRIGRKIILQRGVDITKDEQNNGTVPVVSSGGVSSFHDKPFASGPGVVVGRKGTAGAVYYITEDYWPHDTTLWVKDFRGNHPRYVFYRYLGKVSEPEAMRWSEPGAEELPAQGLGRKG